MTKTTTKTKTQTKCLKTQHMLYFWNPDDLLIPNMILVSYIFRIKHEYFFYTENYTFWVVTGLVSSSSAYKMNTHGMLSLWWWWWWFNHFDTVLMMVMRPICNDNVYGCGGDGHTFSEQSPYFGAPVIQTPSIAQHGQKIGNIWRGHKYTIQKHK